MENKLERFLEAQKYSYELALQEIKNGRKESHWIWYIFPQIQGLGRSSNAEYYGIENLEEAKRYIENPILKQRLLEISTALLSVEGKQIEQILGCIDAVKVKSSMTLFQIVDPEEKVYMNILNKYYNGERDEKTLEILSNNYQYKKNR